MKLVDILARELKEWPEGMSETVGQGHGGYLHGYAGNGHPNAQTTKAIYSMCDNYECEKVTRAQWKAAVDALNAPKSAEWYGSGLPPVGLEIEVLWDSEAPQYITAKIVGHDEGRAVYRLTSGNRKGEYGSDVEFYNKIPNFRPIRTPEQIAAEEREKFVEDMASLTSLPHPESRVVFAMIYDAGYRKIEIVEEPEERERFCGDIGYRCSYMGCVKCGS